MSRRVLVTGATGTLGHEMVPRLTAAGHTVSALSRRQQEGGGVGWFVGDLRTGAGVPAALAAAEVVVHCASDQRADRESAQRLLAAASAAGNPHIVYISIVGVDRIPLGYYRSKLAVEQLIARSGLPFTILRATQFHDLVLRVFEAQRRLPALLVPAGVEVQPIDAGEVADRLVELAGGDSVGRAPDMGGPEVRDVGDLARRFLESRGRHRPVLTVPLPGAVGRGYRSGAHLAPEHADGTITFEQYLRRLLSSP